ncbi:hypothetical protein CPZ30_04900 [Paenibacillus lautus]|nr:hypothetical protein CPZ30_04900 [Paenibacillus lautus]
MDVHTIKKPKIDSFISNFRNNTGKVNDTIIKSKANNTSMKSSHALVLFEINIISITERLEIDIIRRTHATNAVIIEIIFTNSSSESLIKTLQVINFV